MGLDATLDAMPDQANGQLAFEGPEGRVDFGKLHVLTPKRVGIHGIEISAGIKRQSPMPENAAPNRRSYRSVPPYVPSG
jgi:hypothetical protein